MTSLDEAQKALEAHGCKLSVTNSSITVHSLGILIANVTFFIISVRIINGSQVNPFGIVCKMGRLDPSFHFLETISISSPA